MSLPHHDLANRVRPSMRLRQDFRSRACTSAVCRLVDLPRGLLERIYDSLEIKERIKFNAALPRDAVITKTAHTSTENDKKIALLYRFFKHRVARVGLDGILRSCLPSQMHQFMHDNRSDPTVRRVSHDLPQLRLAHDSEVKSPWTSSTQLATLIREGQPLNALTVAWDDISDIREVERAVQGNGTPALFDAFVATDTPFRRRMLSHMSMFFFGVVQQLNETLLHHLMQNVSFDADLGSCIRSARDFMTSHCIALLFIDSPEKLRLIVGLGMTASELATLMEDAAGRLLIPTVDFFSKLGVQL